MRQPLSYLALAAAFLLPSAASALNLPLRAASQSGPTPESGALLAPPGAPPLRAQVTVRYGDPPPPLTAAFQAFVADTGGRPWTALWDTGTSRPTRLFGGSVPAPGSMESAAAAEKQAFAILSRHQTLLLAGRPTADFDLVTNDLDRGLRTVALQQMVRVGVERVPLVGGVVSLRFKANRLFMLGSDALPTGTFPPAQISPDQAETAALIYLSSTHPITQVTATSLVAIPLVRAAGRGPESQRSGPARVVPAYQVETESASPESRTVVYVDARSGEVVATRERIRFLSGSIRYTAPVRGPATHADYPAFHAQISAGGFDHFTDSTGGYEISAIGPATSYVNGQFIRVNSATETATFTFPPVDGEQTIWSLADDELGDAQLSAFVHANIAKENARKIDPGMAFLNGQLKVYVNQSDANYVCNAYWNGITLNFFQQYQNCNNTARVADVVYHEFGHAFHSATALPSVGEFDAGLGEGGADYFASTITNDPQMALGFFTNGGALRDIGDDRRWPDGISWDPHETGLIFAGAMWDLRTILEQELGTDEGPPIAHSLYRSALRGAQNIPVTYAEILAADDDDGDLGNGTPHICEILQAFVPHGLSPYVTPRGGTLVHAPVRVLPGQKDPYVFKASLTEAFPQCPATDVESSVTLHYRTLAEKGDVKMTQSGTDLEGIVPGQPVSAQIRYSIEVKTTSGKSSFPQNVADAEYRVFVGDPIPIQCDDFEASPGAYTFGEIAGKPTDFEWGHLSGNGGDPPSAYSGSYLIGTTLQSDGLYRAKRSSFAEGGVVDVGDHKHIRLQLMRWLTVEDGAFDHATILVNGQRIWENAGTDENDGTLAHQDLEWRFEDIDLSNFTAGGNHTVQLRFELESDGGAQLGGWNLDDICIVAWEQPPPSTGGGGAGGDGGGGAGGGGSGGEDKSNTGCSCRVEDTRSERPFAPFALAIGASVALASRRRRRPS